MPSGSENQTSLPVSRRIQSITACSGLSWFLGREVYGEISYSRHTCPPSLGNTPLPFTTLSTPGCEMVREALVLPKPLRESALKPGCRGWTGCPKREGCDER